MSLLFISDLHFSESRPEKWELFKSFLIEIVSKAEALYILGDIYDNFWVGCDDERFPNRELISTIHKYSKEYKTNIFIMRGNRDCYLNCEFAQKSGAKLIDDPHVINIDNMNILLTHGDKLCTNDTSYQIFRRVINKPFVKYFFLKLPLFLRQKIAGNIRKNTIKATTKKPSKNTDVVKETVIKQMKQYNASFLIHGHTHRQAVHSVKLDKTKGTRIVLGDWYEKDCVLIYENNNFKFNRIEDLLKKKS